MVQKLDFFPVTHDPNAIFQEWDLEVFKRSFWEASFVVGKRSYHKFKAYFLHTFYNRKCASLAMQFGTMIWRHFEQKVFILDISKIYPDLTLLFSPHDFSCWVQYQVSDWQYVSIKIWYLFFLQNQYYLIVKESILFAGLLLVKWNVGVLQWVMKKRTFVSSSYFDFI